jgi:hypothetical protein
MTWDPKVEYERIKKRLNSDTEFRAQGSIKKVEKHALKASGKSGAKH